MYPDHFLDVNILIGSRVPWDVHYDKTTVYMARQNIRRCTSGSGRNLAKGYFDLIRSKGGKFLKDLSETAKAFPDDDLKIREYVFNSIDDFAERRRLSSKQTKPLISFFKNVRGMNRLLDEIRKDNHNGVENFRKYMLSAIEHAILSLKQDCDYDNPQASIRLYDRKGEKGEGKIEYSSLRQRLWDIIQDDEDVEIFLDCHDVQTRRVKANMCFITTDKKHFSNEEVKSQIEEITPRIVIQSPSYRP